MAESWPSRGKVELKPTELALPKSSGRARIVLTAPYALPTFEYQTFDGSRTSISSRSEGAVLINLWASWCRPCLVELKEFAHGVDELRAANVDVVALSVDGIGSEVSDAKTASARWRQLALPFTGGMATVEILDKFQLLHDTLFELHETLAVPTSFLVDRQGRLGAIYKGPVTVKQLVTDAGRIALSGEERRRVALPFSGRWSAPAVDHRLLMVALDMVDKGHLQDTIAYIDKHHAALRQDREFHAVLFNLGQALTKKGDHETAIVYYERALIEKPDLDSAHHNLASSYAMLRKFDKAVPHFRRALEIKPNEAETLYGLGQALGSQGQLGKAMEQFLLAVQVQPDYAPAHFELAVYFTLQGKMDDAIRHYRDAVKLHPAYSNEKSLERFSRAAQMSSSTLEKRGDTKRAAEILRRSQSLQADIRARSSER